MKKLILSLLILLMLILPVQARDGPGVTPSCIQIVAGGGCDYYEVYRDQTTVFEYHVYNFGTQHRTYRMSVDGELAKYIALYPTEFRLSPYDESIIHRDCVTEEGCQKVFATLDFSYDENITFGKYNTYVITETTDDSGGAFAITQSLGSKLMIAVVPKPTLLAQMVRFADRINGAFLAKINDFNALPLRQQIGLTLLFLFAIGFLTMIHLRRRGIEFGFKKTPRFSFEDLYTDSNRRLKHEDFDAPARKESKFKCNICGTLVSESDDTCPGCRAHFK